MFDTRGPIFTGADGGSVLDLGDGRRLWMFGDTYSGPTNATTLLPGFSFLRNSVAVEQGSCITFRLGGTPTAKRDYFPQPGRGQWYWPLDGLVDKNAGLAYVAAMRVEDANGPWGYRWRLVRNEFLLIDLTTLAVVGTKVIPAGGGLDWGMSIAEDANYIYMYASAAGAKQFVARTSRAHLFDTNWEYYTANGWSTDGSKVYPMRFQNFNGAPEKGANPAITVDSYGNGYLASAKRCDIFCPDMTAWYAQSPQGPWRAVNNADGRVAWTPVGANQVAYGGHMVNTRAGWLATWSVNRTIDLIENKNNYGIRLQTPWHLPPPATIDSIFAPSASARALAPNPAPPVAAGPEYKQAPVAPGTQVFLPTSSGFSSP